MPLSPGEKLGPYEILASIGEGGMGEVWKARDTRLDRIVALKVSKREFSERFEREARSIAALNHPHICQLYDVVISKDAPNYLVMEFVEGSPLKGPLPLEQALRFAAQICDALDAAHRKGITHRDLKPANIIVTKQGIKLLDFGLAKLKTAPLAETDSTVTQPLTAQGQILGTLQYMSPEQLQGKEADARSDLFSFGCVLYEMLTGKRAFEGASPASVIAAILEREPAPLNLAPPLERVIQACLAKDPDERIQTARDMKKALLWAVEPQIVIPRGSRWWWVAVAGALVLGIGAAWGIAHMSQPAAPVQGALRLEINPPEGGRFVFGGNVGGIALSPDGKVAAFVATVGGKTALWVRPLDGTTARLLPGTEGAEYPFWSPDSKTIGFFAGGKLQRVELAGGTPLAICDVSGLSLGGSWSEDGYIIANILSAGLIRVPATGGAPSPLTALDASRNEGAHRWPQALPGGRFLHEIQSGKAEVSGIYARSLVKPAERVQLAATSGGAVYAPGGDGKNYLLWLRGGALVAQELDVNALKLLGEPRPVADPVDGAGVNGQINVAASANGLLLYSSTNALSQLKWFDRTGKPLGILGDPAQYEMFRLSPDGRRVAVSLLRQNGADLWLTDVERGVASRFSSRPGVNYFPVWSSDGRNIVFGSGVSVVRDLFRKEVNGAGMEELLRSNERVTNAMDWSRDGHWLLYFDLAAGTQRDMWMMEVTPDGKPVAGAPPKSYLRTAANEWQGRFSPESNPRWVAYQSDESGRYEVYINSFPQARSKTRISTAGGVYPQWGPGGRELFYMSPENKLMAVSVKLGADSIEASAPRELFTLPVFSNGLDAPYDVAPDGQRFLVRAAPQQQAAQPLTLIVNWPALLKGAAAR
jgi:Tol biopolymer transport system component/predicted Ser/Thr protein kinase